MRHTDAGYEEAIKTAKERKIKIPGVTIYEK
jgi:urocanate hydratase